MRNFRLLLTLGLLSSLSFPLAATKPASFCSLSANGNKIVSAAQSRLCGRGITLLAPAPTGGEGVPPQEAAPLITSPASEEAAETAVEGIDEAMDDGANQWSGGEQFEPDVAAVLAAEHQAIDEDERAAIVPTPEPVAVDEAQVNMQQPDTTNVSALPQEGVVERATTPESASGDGDDFEMPAVSAQSVDSPRSDESPRFNSAAEEEAALTSVDTPRYSAALPQQIRRTQALSEVEGLSREVTHAKLSALTSQKTITTEVKAAAKKELRELVKAINYEKSLAADGGDRLQIQYLDKLRAVTGLTGGYKEMSALADKAKANNIKADELLALRAYVAQRRMELLVQNNGDCADHPELRGCDDWEKLREAAGLSGGAV